MKVRLTRWAMSPRTPQRMAHAAVELGVLLAAVLVLVAVASGWASHVLAAGLVDAVTLAGGAR